MSSSGETGTMQIYAERFPEPGRKVQISLEGGRNPHWSSDGKKIFYRDGDRFFMVPVMIDSSLEAGRPELIFEVKDIIAFDMFHPTGEFYALQRAPGCGIQTRLHLVASWFSELQRLAPASKK